MRDKTVAGRGSRPCHAWPGRKAHTLAQFGEAW